SDLVLAEHGRVELDALAAALAARYEAEPWRGYGAQTHILLGKIHGGGNWRELARAINDGQGSYGNDAAARVAPLGAYFQDDGDERIAAQARLSAEVTHSHPLARDGAAAVALAAAWMGRQGEAIAAGEADSDGMFALVLEHVREEPLRALIEQARALSADTPVRDVTDALGCGRQVTAQDTVPFCLWAAARNAGNFEAAMWTTVSGLGDRDTNCAIVGGIVAAGAGVPGGWVKRRERV
ncbi:MAG: ADP-ribosylglycohydrolase family protein, partial [Sumerlaeia bacterium]